MPAAIDAEAGDACRAAARQRRAFQKNARKLRTIEQNVVRPFEAEARIGAENAAHRIEQRETRDETELGQMLRRCRIDQQKRRIKIAGRRRPRPAPAAPTLNLLARDEPHATGIAFARKTHRLFVRRADAVANNQTIGCGLCRCAELHDASEKRLRGRGRSLDNGRRINPEDQHEDGG